MSGGRGLFAVSNSWQLTWVKAMQNSKLKRVSLRWCVWAAIYLQGCGKMPSPQVNLPSMPSRLFREALALAQSDKRLPVRPLSDPEGPLVSLSCDGLPLAELL